MKKFIIIAILSFLIFVFVYAGTNELQKPKEKELQAFLEYLKAQDIDVALRGVGRYKIFQHSQVVKNTFLLDTMGGKVWMLVEDPETKALFWQKLYVEED